MEMVIIGIACAAGHMLNKDGKQRRKNNPDVVITKNNMPSGTLIYDSNRVREVDEYIRDLAAQKHGQRVKQMYPQDYDKPVSVVPNDEQSGYPASLANLGGFADAVPAQFQQNVATAIKLNGNTAAYNPQTGNAFAFYEEDLDSTPMFRSSRYKQPGENTFSEFGGPFSLLSGQPLDMTHGNMQPAFGGMVKQPSVSNDNSQVLLEKFTGIPSSDNQGTYVPRREVVNQFPNNPENPQRAQIGQLSDLYNRAESGIKASHEFVSPVKSYRDLPLSVDQIRIMPGDPDATRGVNKKQVSYSGVLIPGQMGSNRGMLPKLAENRYDMSFESLPANIIGNKAVLEGTPQIPIPSVRNVNSTSIMQGEYLAPPTDTLRNRDVSGMVNRTRMREDEQVTKRMEAFTPGFGAAQGMQKGPNTGVLIMNDPEKGFETEYINQPHKSLGSRMRNVDAPEATVRDTLGKAVGPINPQGRKYNEAWKDKEINVEVTNKAMNAKNSYARAPHKNLGMGTRKTKYKLDATNKEINQFSQQGNPTSKVPAHMSYKAVFHNDTNKTVKTKRMGIAKGENAKPVIQGKIEADAEKLMVKDYINNPTGKKKMRNRKQFNDGVTKQTTKLNFGGYFHNGKYGNGDDAKRKGAVRVKKEMVVSGRVNVGLQHDNPNEGGLPVEVELKEEAAQVERKIYDRIQPTEVVTNRMPVVIRVSNTEAVNPRMDTGVRLTNDLYPWIKK